VGFTPRTSVALTDTDTDGAEEHPYGYAHDPFNAAANDSMDERDVEAMLLAEQEQADRSMQYEQDEQHAQYYQQQYGDEDLDSEEDFGFLQQQQDWPHEILTV